jgi:hypothetical protein
MGNVARKAGWVLLGIVGSIAIVAVWLMTITLQVPVKIRSGYGVHTNQWDEGYVGATGTWVIDNDRQAFPVQYTELTCFLPDKQCRSATGEIVFGDTLSVSTERYDIVRWTADTIIFTTASAMCVDYTYTISRANQRVVGTRSPKKNRDSLCTTGAETLQLSLTDGFKVTQQLESEASARTQPFMWAALVVLWIFIGFRIFRKKAKNSLVLGPA